MHWATIRVQVRRTPSTPQVGEFRVKGNTPDFMLEHFIILYGDVTAGTPHRWGVTLIARTIQHNSTKDDIGSRRTKNPAMHNGYILESCGE